MRAGTVVLVAVGLGVLYLVLTSRRDPWARATAQREYVHAGGGGGLFSVEPVRARLFRTVVGARR